MRAMPNVTREVSMAEVALRYFPPPQDLSGSASIHAALARLIRTLNDLYERGEKSGFSVDALYQMDRINNSADFDLYLIPMARAAGYESLQFLTQANGMGGWAHEIVALQARVLYKPEERKWRGWEKMGEWMRDGCGNVCEPDYSKWMTTCKGMELPRDCLGAPNELPAYGFEASVSGAPLTNDADAFRWPDGHTTGSRRAQRSASAFGPLLSKVVAAVDPSRACRGD